MLAYHTHAAPCILLGVGMLTPGPAPAATAAAAAAAAAAPAAAAVTEAG